MKRILLSLALACITVFSYAQKDLAVGIRFEVAEVEDNDDGYTIFKYKDQDGSIGYYLSLMHQTELLGIVIDNASSSLSHFNEVCLNMGATSDDAIAFLDDLLELVGEDTGTTRDFEARLTNGAEFLTDSCTTTCYVKKGFLSGKYLDFVYEFKDRTQDVELRKGAIKSLRSTLKFNKKLHPDW